jgi:CHAD domain-containing protein
MAQALHLGDAAGSPRLPIGHAMTLLDIFQREIETIRTHHAGVLDGEHNSIHDARIATRRIREVLPLTHEWQRRDHADELQTMLRRMGRSLGRVRDADVRIQLIGYLEARIPHAAPSLVLIRQREEHGRLRIMRKLVKRFERLGVDRELARLANSGPWLRTSWWAARTGSWREQLRRRVEERATAAADAITHATGIYFPRRVHAARIDIKKLRYAAEIGVDTCIIGDGSPLRALRKSQDLLGDLHDRQTLIDELRETCASDARIDPSHIGLVEQVVEADIADLHGRFLKRRLQIREACDGIGADVRRPRTAVRAVAIAGAVAVVTGLEARRRLRRHRHENGDGNAVAVRVPVPLRNPIAS